MKYELKGKRVTVIGMGKSGISAATLLAKKGSQVLMVDDQQKKPPPSFPASIRLKFGGWANSDLLNADLIVLSPGIPLSRLPMAQLEKSNIPVLSEVELASSLLSAPLIGITGTNGKSTTTTLVGNILKDWGLQVFVGGNLGIPLSEAVFSKWDFVVAELSSFQLETITTLRPRIAALLNITPDHLDRYPDLFSYQKAKWRIFENQLPQDHAIVNSDDPLTTPASIQGSAVTFSRTHPVTRGVYLHEGAIKTTIWGEPEQVCHLNDLKTGSAVHIENILAAVAITQLCGCSVAEIAQTLRTFKGLPHRMEFVGTHKGVQYLNDSKGTNTGALMRSLEGLSSPVILIAGGRDKAADFSPLRAIMRNKVKQMILMGEAKGKMAKCFSDHPAVEKIEAEDGMKAMEAAVTQAAAIAQAGETVLLSPGCASFDLFQDYQHRGNTFKTVVKNLS